uniref:Carboxypeptidase n=1 Tax=Syphacia muris TaxID=451379 RepID=A0A0N5ABM4_9BILA
FAESQHNATGDPLILWIHGGPGCSGLSAYLTENGPFTVTKGGNSLSINEYSWNKFANFLVIESPVGVGYSYADNGDLSNNDEAATEDNWQALKAFFTEHPSYLNNDLYIIGESYGGVTVPLLSKKILQNQQNLHMNLKGIGIGNGYVSKSLDTNTLVLYAYTHGMIDEKVWQKVSEKCCNGNTNECAFYSFTGWDFCSLFVQEAIQNIWFDGIYAMDIYLKCSNDNSMQYQKFLSEVKETMPKKPLSHLLYAINSLCWNEPRDSIYLNLDAVREALNVSNSVRQWYSCSGAVYDNYDQMTHETKTHYKDLANAGIQMLFYSGDTDMVCNFLQGQQFVDGLGYSQTSPKSVYRVSGQVGGQYAEYGQIRFATVRGAGHIAAAEKPDVLYHLIDAFLKNMKP